MALLSYKSFKRSFKIWNTILMNWSNPTSTWWRKIWITFGCLISMLDEPSLTTQPFVFIFSFTFFLISNYLRQVQNTEKQFIENKKTDPHFVKKKLNRWWVLGDVNLIFFFTRLLTWRNWPLFCVCCNDKFIWLLQVFLSDILYFTDLFPYTAFCFWVISFGRRGSIFFHFNLHNVEGITWVSIIIIIIQF